MFAGDEKRVAVPTKSDKRAVCECGVVTVVRMERVVMVEFGPSRSKRFGKDVGHIGTRDRDLTRLKEDIAVYRAASPGVRFRIEHQFGDGTYVATRVTAHAPTEGDGGVAPMAVGLNISRWEGGLLAEEWAVWETRAPSD